MSRHCYLSPPQMTRLHWACAPFRDARIGYGVHLVGSVLSRPDYRDIDLRLILSDDEFTRIFGARGDGFAWLRLVNTALSLLVGQAAALDKPIDFQIQPLSHANSYTGPRNPMGLRDRIGGVDVPLALDTTEADR